MGGDYGEDLVVARVKCQHQDAFLFVFQSFLSRLDLSVFFRRLLKDNLYKQKIW